MNTRTLSITAIALWFVTVAVIGYLFVVGRTAPTADGRQAILLNPEEKDLILTEMRNMLISVQGVVEGINNNDMKYVATSARLSGSAAAAKVPPALMAKLPVGFKQLGQNTHQGFDEVVVGAENGEPGDMLLVRLGDHMKKCVACHAAYRLDSSVAK